MQFPQMYNDSISIHALPRRATVKSSGLSGFSKISIHALPRRATAEAKEEVDLATISIHALPRRATQRSSCNDKLYGNFNPRPPAEGDA